MAGTIICIILENNLIAKFQPSLLVCIYVAGLLVVVGGVVVQSDETDRLWSEALFALTCCSSDEIRDLLGRRVFSALADVWETGKLVC